MGFQYDSGRTGPAKGAMLVHKVGLVLLPHLLYAMDVRADDVFWGGADPGWAYGLFACLTDPLMIGKAARLIESPFTPELAWQGMERYGVTNFTHAPTADRALSGAGVELSRNEPNQLRTAHRD